MKFRTPFPKKYVFLLSTVCGLLVVLLTSSFADDIRFCTNFPGARLGKITPTKETHSFNIELSAQQDNQNLNRQMTWFAFRMENLPVDQSSNQPVGSEVTLIFTNFDGCYNNRPTKPNWTGVCPVLGITEGRNIKWTNIPASQSVWSPESRTLTIRFTPTESVMYCAYTVMYTENHLQTLLNDLCDNQFVQPSIIGQSIQGRNIPLLTITDFSVPAAGKRYFWILARQHAWEAHTSWQADGMARFLAGTGADATEIRKRCVFSIVPIVDVDGTENGEVRFNGNGFDVNRYWKDVDITRDSDYKHRPEVAYLKRAMIEQHRISPITAFINLHNDTVTDYIDAAGDPDKDFPNFKKFDQLLNQCQLYDPNPNHPITLMTDRDRYVPTTFDLWWDNNIPGLMIEQKVHKNRKLGREPTIEDSKRRGTIIAQFLDQAFGAHNPENLL